jgi:pyridoxal biosynthesis lyase PdxS
MNFLFELFRGGIIVEISNMKQVKQAEKAGAVALLIDASNSSLHPEGEAKKLEEILKNSTVPVICSFRPGHSVEAEVLSEMGAWGLYADSRLDPLTTKNPYKHFKNTSFPFLQDIDADHEILEEKASFIPVFRGESMEEILQSLEKKKKEHFIFTAGPIETVSDIALLKRMGADVIIIPESIFQFQNTQLHLQKLVQASFYYNNTKKLTEILGSL